MSDIFGSEGSEPKSVRQNVTVKISRKSSSGWLQPVFHFGPEIGEEQLKNTLNFNFAPRLSQSNDVTTKKRFQSNQAEH